MAPLPPDPYKTLGVSKTAEAGDIRTAYRKLVLTCHPDKVQDPAQKEEKLAEFQKLQHAYELLSSDKERTKYDEQVKLMELRKDMSKGMANTSAPRTPKTPQTYNISIRTAEPRSSPYAQSPPQAGSRLYAQYSNSPKDAHIFVDERGMGRTPKRSPSYEKPTSRREKDLDEDRERDRARRRRGVEEREEEARHIDRERVERERERRAGDKESRRAEKKRRDKERSDAYDEKRRHRSTMYVEEYDEEAEKARSEKKKSSSRKHRERERESTPKVGVLADKTDEKLATAHSYIKRSSGVPGLGRAATFDSATFRHSPPSAPTPPPAGSSHYPAPPAPSMSDEDEDEGQDEEQEVVHRSRAPSRRGSYDTPRSRDRFIRKKSLSSVQDETILLSTSPGHLSSMAGESPPRSLPKSSTFHEGGRRSAARPLIPSMPRSYTYACDVTEPRVPRDRSRSRYVPQRFTEMEEEDEDELRHQGRKHRSSRRESSTGPIFIPTPAKKPSYGGDGRSLGRESSAYRGSPDRPGKSYFPSSGSSGYRILEAAYSPQPRSRFPKPKTMKEYGYQDVEYAKFGSGYHHEIDTYH